MLPIVHHARETRTLSETINRLPPAERAVVEQALIQADPLQYAAGLRQRARQGRVLMINAGEDEVIPRACTEKLASALGIQDRVVWLDGLGHYTALAALPKALKTAVDFFAQDLPADVAAAAGRCRGCRIAPAKTREVAPAVLVAGGRASRQPGIATWRTWRSRLRRKTASRSRAVSALFADPGRSSVFR